MTDDLRDTFIDEDAPPQLCPACELPTEHALRPHQPYCPVCRRGRLEVPPRAPP